ncbi:MAG: sugar ABC transporter permease [Lachnospiraceae bacterium]|nr:sugar ABC transporter permease [Lachnospiraceae bacterium]
MNKKTSLWVAMKNAKFLYLLLVPGILYFILFKYLPMGWLIISFQDYKLLKGISGSEWIGLKNFINFFSSMDCWMIIKNTIIINVYNLIFAFPASVIFALLLNEVRKLKVKKVIQTISYLPHFISTVIMVGLIQTMFSSAPPGPLFKLFSFFNGSNSSILANADYFRGIFVGSAIWQQTGWNSIVFIAALAGIDPTYYEAAIVDGASRIQQLIYITIPSILNTVFMMLIIQIGRIMSVGVDKAYLLQTDTTRQVSEVISTYVYKKGMQGSQYGYATAVSVFNSVIGLILVVAANKLSKKFSQSGLW